MSDFSLPPKPAPKPTVTNDKSKDAPPVPQPPEKAPPQADPKTPPADKKTVEVPTKVLVSQLVNWVKVAVDAINEAEKPDRFYLDPLNPIVGGQRGVLESEPLAPAKPVPDKPIPDVLRGDGANPPTKPKK